MWCNEDVQQALQRCRAEKLLLLIFVRGKNAESEQMTSLLESDEELSSLIANQTIALKLEDGSANARLFSSICPIVVLPSIFLISHDGIPLEIIGGATEQSNVQAKIVNAIKKQKQRQATTTTTTTTSNSDQSASSAQATTSMSQAQNQNTADQAAASSSSPLSSPADKKAANALPSEPPKTKESQPEANAQPEEVTAQSDAALPMSIEDRLERANRLIEQNRAKRAQEEEQAEKRRELERIAAGKNLQSIKRQQEERELEDLIAKRKKEQQEEAAAKQRVLQLIKLDHEERKAREQAERLLQQQQQLIEQQEKNDESIILQRRKTSQDEVKIQFRLPDGGTLTTIFKQHQPLQECYAYVQQEAGIEYFSLVRSYPKKAFLKEDYEKSFEQLQLTPSAVLLVLHESGPSSTLAPAAGQIGKMFLSPFILLYNLVQMLLNFIGFRWFGGNADDGSASASASGNPSVVPSASSGRASVQREAMRQNRQRLLDQQQQQDRGGSKLGSLSSLRDDSHSDDENKTYNGNSVQQLPK